MKRIGILGIVALFISCAKKQDLSLTDTGAGFAIPTGQLPPGVTPSNPEVDPIAPVTAVPVKGIVAVHSVEIGENAEISSDIAVVGEAQSGSSGAHHQHHCRHGRRPHESAAELTFSERSIAKAGFSLKADTIRAKDRAVINARMEANEYRISSRAIAGDRHNLGQMPELPVFLRGTPGGLNINVRHNQSLNAGAYRAVQVQAGKTLILAGGYYQIDSLDMREKAKLHCGEQKSCIILVKGIVKIGSKSIVGAISANANDMVFYVESEGAAHKPSVSVAEKANINANIYAANGNLSVGARVQARGIFIAERVQIGSRARLVGVAGSTQSVAKLFEAGKAGAIEIPGKVRLEIPACALSEDVVISVTNEGPVAQQPADQYHIQRNLRILGDTFNLQPSGLEYIGNYSPLGPTAPMISQV